jgi:hypothetical protein
MTGFVVNRTANGTNTTFTLPRTEAATYRWVDSQVIAGATYAVSAVSADGEGASSTPAAVGPITNAIAVEGLVPGRDKDRLAGIAGRGVLGGSDQHAGPRRLRTRRWHRARA